MAIDICDPDYCTVKRSRPWLKSHKFRHDEPNVTLSLRDLTKNTPSPFCSLFSLEEFQAYEYLGDLDKYYHHTGYVFPVARVELLSTTLATVNCLYRIGMGKSLDVSKAVLWG
jgi:hypothetical protein